MLDVEAVERAERQIDAFIEKRQAQRTGADEQNALETLWAASERRELARRREENRRLWIAHFEALVRIHIRLARDARRRARELQTDVKEKAS